MTDLEAPIRDVTVYADRALITRHGQIQLEAGEHELRINNLPQFQRDSLRAAGQGPQGTRILNVDVTTAFYSRPPAAAVQKLQDELEQLQQQQQLLKARQEALNDRRQWLRSIGEQSRDFARGLAHGHMAPQDCSAFFSFMADQTLQDAAAAQELELQQKHVQRDISAKQRELLQMRGQTAPDRLAAVVNIALAEAGDFTLEISYLVNNASWYPQYDVRVEMNEEQNNGTVEVTYIGMVQQTTGEPWENVELALSTARPGLAARLPELKPWYLSLDTPPTPPVLYAAAAPAPRASARHFAKRMRAEINDEDKESAFDDSLGWGATASQAVVAEVATATVEHTGTALVFRVGRSVDIPSDNSPHKTTIARDSLPCEFDYVSAPAIEQFAHLRATITNTTERVLLKGDASIFLHGEYVGTTQVKTTAASEQFKVFLGIEDRIKIKHEAIERSVEKGNLLQNDLRRSTYAYRITVHNYADTARKLNIRDHLPVSQHERIKIKVQNIQPQPTEHTKLEILKWKFTLPADGEQKIEYRFVVEHPQGMMVSGLPPQTS